MPARPPEFVSKAASKGELSEVVKWLRKGGDVDAEDDFRGETSSSGITRAEVGGVADMQRRK